jgi:LysR family transcriptional regulator, glycine cleavage system transcriptional activator
MTSAIPPLLGLHAYEAAARHLSFAAAAAELHLSASAVSQRVRSLEAHLGVQLFERLPRSLRLTPMGEAYLPAIRGIFADLSAATTGLFGGTEKVSLTVRVQIAYAVTWLAPRLADFCASFPHIDLKLVSAIWADALPPTEIDLEIRQGNGSWPGFISTKLHDDTAVAIYGAQLLTSHGPANTIDDLLPHGRVHLLGFDDLWRHILPSNDGMRAAPPRVLTVDTSIAALQVVSSSAYWAFLPERFVRRAVGAGDVFVARDSSVRMRQDHYVLRRDDASQISGEASAFIQWLRAQDLLDPLRPDGLPGPGTSA